MFRAFGSLIGDILAVVLFVAIGLIQHDVVATATNIALVGWPFLLGMLVGHLAIRSWRAPFGLWPHGVFVWAITVVAAMAIRTLFGAQPPVAFVIVTAVSLAVLMLGWRAVALFVTRKERRGRTVSRREVQRSRRTTSGATETTDTSAATERAEATETSTATGATSATETSTANQKPKPEPSGD